MSSPGNKNPALNAMNTLVVTGNPKVDATVRYVLVAACSGATGVIMTWLNAHGFNDPNLTLMISGAIAAILSTVALAIWGVIRSSKIEAIVQLREAIALQAGINVAESTSPTPQVVTVAEAQKVIAEHASPLPPETK